MRTKKNYRATLSSNTQPSRKRAPPLTAPTRQNSSTRPSTSTSPLCAHPQQRAAPAQTTTAPAQVVRPVVVVVEVGAPGAGAGVRAVTDAIATEMNKRNTAMVLFGICVESAWCGGQWLPAWLKSLAGKNKTGFVMEQQVSCPACL